MLNGAAFISIGFDPVAIIIFLASRFSFEPSGFVISITFFEITFPLPVIDSTLFALNNPDSRLAIVAPTFADGRDTCIEGESGLLSIMDEKIIANYNLHAWKIVLHGGLLIYWGIIVLATFSLSN